MKKSGKYKCPRCGEPMHKNGHTPAGRPRWICETRGSDSDGRVKICYTTTNPHSEAPRTQRGGGEVTEEQFPVFQRELPEGADTFIITAAQNATPIIPAAWASLMRAVKHFKAELLIQPLSYHNPTSIWSERMQTRQWWDPRTVPYLWNVRRSLNKNLEFLADINIIPTASEPVNGLEGFGAQSKIVGHTKLHFKTVATPGHKMAAALTTTGAITKKNYTRSRVGKLGDFHHTVGAVLVEIEGPYFWLRHLNMNSRGEFIDLDKRFTPRGVRKAPRPAAIALGDTHARVADPVVDAATFGPKGIVERYRPRRIIWHDLQDGQSHNPHDRHDPFVEQALATENMDDVEAEVKFSVNYAASRTPPWATSYIVASNHDDFLRRWIVDQDWKKLSTKNRAFYLRNALLMVEGAALVDGMPEYPSPFPYWITKRKQRNLRALGLGESLMVEGVQCGFHGHKGPNGSKGSIKNMRRIGEKTMIAHGHGPGINEGSMQIGHNAKPNQPYARGAPSSWMHTDGIIYPGGKRQLITIVNGRHRRG